MEEDPRARKLAKRVTGELSDLYLLEQTPAPNSDFERLAKAMLEDPDMIDSLCYDDGVTSRLREITLKGKLSREQLLELSKNISAAVKDSLLGAYIEALSSFSEQDYHRTTDILCSRNEFTEVKDAMDILKVSCYSTGDYSRACIFLSGAGSYDDVLFEGLRKEKPEPDTVNSLLKNAEGFPSSTDVCRIYSFVSDYDKSDSTLVALARCLIETGDLAEGRKILGKIEYQDSNSEEFLKSFIGLCMQAQDVNNAYRAAKIASSAFPENIEFSYMKAVGLHDVGREDESVEALEQIIRDHPEHQESRAFLAGIYYDKGNYSKFVEVAYPIKQSMEDDLDWMLRYVNAEVNASDLDGAFRDIKKLESRFPQNVDILRIELDIQILINDTNEAFLTSKSIFEKDRSDKKGRDYYFNELFVRQEFEEFLKRLDEYGSDSGHEAMKLSSLIYLGDLDRAISYAGKNTEVLSDENVLDAILFMIRDDESIVRLLDIVKKEGHPLLTIVLRFIQGLKTTWNEENLAMVEKSQSLATAWILAKSTINFRDRVKPELINNLLARSRFNVVNNIIDAIFLIYSGRVTDDMADSRRFFYPLTEALIGAGDFVRAQQKLDNAYNPKNPDAFYYFCQSVIDLNREDPSAAGKNIGRALEILTNANFLVQKIRVLLAEDDMDATMETIDSLSRMNAAESLCFSDIYRYVTKKNDQEVRNRFLEKFDELELKNIWIDRMKRDKMAEEKDYDGATRVSRVIVVSRSKNLDDIRTHAEILKASSRENEREEFLESVETETTDPMIDIWIGDSYFLKKDYEKAIEFYSRAVEKGEKPVRIRNYPEALIESGKFGEAELLIKSIHPNNLLLLKLYHRMGRIVDIVRLLETLTLETREDEEVIKYISRILWINRQIRDTLVNLFNESRNLILGRIIVDRMIESRDFAGAEKVMRTIMKDYPDDLENLRRLADLLYETKHPSEACTILLRALKIVDSKEDGESILNTIMKIYYETGNYEEIQKLYSVNTDYVNSANIQWIVRSFIETYDFDMADRIIGFYHGKVIPEDTFNELIEEMNSKKEFLRLQEYAARIFDVEFKVGKVLRTEEIVSMTDIPLKVVEEVYHFIDSGEYYREQDEQRYEILTRDLFRRIVKKTNVDSIIYVKINVIFHSLPKRDVILAKNLYIYIKKCLRRRRSPMLNDKPTNALLKQALKMGLRREPLEVAYGLNIGIDEAMNIITLMEYVSSLNR